KKRQSPTGLPQYLKSEIYASQTIQAFTCGFTDAAQLCIGKLSFRALHRNPLKYRNFLQYQKIAYKSI
ncbi:hypothetical protein ACTHT2_22990, partial [Neisseria sp. P0017.S006]|uniref:hypothetical protein n=1 Tax=Neisseria sp. P0017.S006 TaxID=3436782 RepID=UPI003F7E3ABC